MSLKKKIILFSLLLPSIIINFFTLTILDHDNNLSLFSSTIVIVFNLVNLTFAVIYFRYNFRIFFSLLAYCMFLLIISDLILEKVLNQNSIIKDDKILGWTLKPNKKVKINQRTMKVKSYVVNWETSNEEGFREFGDLRSDLKKILVVGDSYTGGPFSSNEKMYYNVIKNKIEKNKIFLDWFVLGSPGYGTTQQIILLERYWEKIKPDYVLYQFCVNDFFDNSIKISKFSSSQNQYYRRPYFQDGKIVKVDTVYASIYRFLYRYSYTLKKLDAIYSYQKFKKHGRFTKNIPESWIQDSIKETGFMFKKVRNIIGEDTLLFSTNCVDERNTTLSPRWVQIIKSIKGHPIDSPTEKLTELKKRNIDVMNIDGGHLNDEGNKIYGEIIADEMIKILKYEKN